MKYLIITALSIVWLACLVEFAALATVALRVQNTGSLGAIFMMLSWLALTGVCGWKWTRSYATSAA
jgi:hypothetical protein